MKYINKQLNKQYIVYTIMAILLIFIIENDDISKGIVISWIAYHITELWRVWYENRQRNSLYGK